MSYEEKQTSYHDSIRLGYEDEDSKVEIAKWNNVGIAAGFESVDVAPETLATHNAVFPCSVGCGNPKSQPDWVILTEKDSGRKRAILRWSIFKLAEVGENETQVFWRHEGDHQPVLKVIESVEQIIGVISPQ